MMRNFSLLTFLLVILAVAGGANAQDTDSAGLVYLPSECIYSPGQPTSEDCLQLMADHPEPNFDRAPLDRQSFGIYSFWKVGPDATPKFDAPGGNPVGEIPAGFNFITAVDTSQPDWLQITGGEWVSRTGARYVEPSSFSGILLPEGWNQPFAWVLDMTGIYASVHPGEAGSKESGYVTRRYDLVNIFAEAYDAEGWRWYMIGPNQWIKQTFVAKVQPAPQPEDVSDRWVAVDLYEQTLIAYEDDMPVFATLVSSGLDNWGTNEGLFTIWARMPVDSMSGATGAPDAYALQTVPWTMYFDGSISLHGTYWHDLFGYRRSHGCVNLSISDARWIFEWTGETEPDASAQIVNHVYVFSSGEYGAPPNA